MGALTDRADALTEEFEAWGEAQKLDLMCASDMLFAARDGRGTPLTPEQMAWLNDFEQRWDAVQDEADNDRANDQREADEALAANRGGQ